MSKKSKTKRKKTDQIKRKSQVEQPKQGCQIETNNKSTKDKQDIFSNKILGGVVRWALAIITVIVSIWGLYYTHKLFEESRPPQLSILFGYGNYDIKDIIDIDRDKNWRVDILTGSHSRSCSLGYRHVLDYLGFPVFYNNTNKTIKDLRLKVQIKHEKLKYDISDVNPDFSIIYTDTVFDYTILIYNQNSLNPRQEIGSPISFVKLPEDIPFSENKVYIIEMLYDISYDGMSKNQSFVVYCYTYFDRENAINITDKHIDGFLNYCYSNNLFDYSIVAIRQRGRTYVVTPQNKSSKEEFGEFKKQFIDKVMSDMRRPNFSVPIEHIDSF